MINPLGQGLLTGGQKTLAPSTRALGPNVYFGKRVFLTMLGIALLVHVTILIILGLTRPQHVTDIPVRALSFKIGDSDVVAAQGSPAAPPAPAMNADTGSWHASPLTPPPKPRTQPRPKVTPPVLEPIPVINRTVVTPPQPVPVTPPQPLQAAQPDTPPAIAPTPQHYIREVGAAPQALGVATAQAAGQMTEAAAQEVRERYEQQISSWIELHKLYPAAAQGVEGRTIVRIRIDRSGYVRYYAIEQSSSNAALDAAAVDMIRRANPVPAVPTNYPAGALIEFLIPITFKVPR